MKPKRIIHVTNFGFKPVRDYLHSSGKMISNGFTLAGHDVINFSDRDFSRWLGLFGSRKLGVGSTNKLLLDICKNTRPDVLVFGHADVIKPQTILAIKEAVPEIKVIQWNVDLLVDDSHYLSKDPNYSGDNERRLIAKKDVVDATFITLADDTCLKRISDAKHPAYFMPNPMDIAITREKNFEKNNLPFDVMLAANDPNSIRHHCGNWQAMNDLYDNISKAIPDLRISNHGVKGGKRVLGPDYQDALSNCSMGLSINVVNDVYLYASNRMAHFIGNGIATFVDRASGFGDVFEEDELVFYSTEAELMEKLADLKRDDKKRRTIAEKGYNRYYELFSNKKVAQYMLDVVYGEVEGNSIIVKKDKK